MSISFGLYRKTSPIVLTLVVGLGAIHPVTQADDSTTYRPMQGWYTGIEAGHINLDLKGHHEDVAPFRYRKDGIDLDYSKATWGGFAGHGWYRGSQFLGVEIDAQKFKDDIDDSFLAKPEGDNKFFHVTNGWKLQVSGLFGKQLPNDWLVYGRAGLAYTDIEVSTLTVTAIDSAGNPTEGFSGSVHDWIGGVVGAGVAIPLFERWSVRAEYNFTTYFIGPEYNNDKNDGEKTDYDLDDHRIFIGLAYSF